MLFELFPSFVYQRSEVELDNLPVEISSIILRMLDEESLVNAALVNRSWSRICRGDPVLRRRVRRKLRKNRRMQRETTLDPSRGVKVIRSGPKSLFNTNAIKIVKIKKLTGLEDERNAFTKKQKQIGPIRRYTNSEARVKPYKVIRI